MLSIKNILHATDFSAESDWAFQLACALASDFHANLIIVHVISSPPPLNDGAVFPLHDEHEDELSEMLQRLRVPDRRVEVIRRLEEGNPGTEILRLAQLSRADLIVMGTHNPRGLKHLLIGSVVEKVMRHANCPVLTVSAPAPAEANGPTLRRQETVHSSAG